MVRSKGSFPNPQRPLVERLSLGILAPGIVEHRRVVEDFGHSEMVRSQDSFSDRQHPLLDSLRVNGPTHLIPQLMA